MKRHNKLVRDNIPATIAAEGKQCETKLIRGNELISALKEKLREELLEFDEDHDPEELADILEVVYALASSIGLEVSELNIIRKHKAAKNGTFSTGVFLVSVDP
jgi:predicted house-cleaning noncanonical NTP pyrophosphatase (MazG superfamily)